MHTLVLWLSLALSEAGNFITTTACTIITSMSLLRTE
jgi:hypothetical protein